MLRSAANAGTIERLRMNADDLLTRAHAIELDTETIRRHGIETRARTHILLMRMLTLAAVHDPRSVTQAGPDGQIGRIIDACDRTGEDGDAERLLRRHGPARGAAGKGEEPRMAISMTKLSSADYYLDRTREALQADGAIPDEATPGPLTGPDPAAYYNAEGNPPGRWIGSASRLLGGETGRQAGAETVRMLINERRNPETGRSLDQAGIRADNDGSRPSPDTT